MPYNLRTIYKKVVSISLIISVIGIGFLPVFSTRVEAALPVIDVPHTAVTAAEAGRKSIKDGLDLAARILAQTIIQQVVNSTVEWAESGFEGNPAYAVDPKQYFTNIADGVIGDVIYGSDIGFLCSPFQLQVQLALQKHYFQQPVYQCTLSDIVQNIEGFYGDFSQGGWDAWFSMTQVDANNPYGAYLQARADIDSRLASAIGIESQKLDWNQGFISWSECLPGGTDPHTGECRPDMRGPTKTPGSIIKSQLDRVLPASLERVIGSQNFENLATAFVTGVLTKYVFGNQGLFSGGSNDLGYTPSAGSGYPSGQPFNPSPNNGVDIDGDGIEDIIDTDGDGNLDLCLFGGDFPICSGVSSDVIPNPIDLGQ